MKTKSISVVIVDDETDARDLMAQVIGNFKELSLVGSACNAFEGFQLINKLKPEIAFLDINMPMQSGLELAELVTKSQRQTSIVFVTAYDAYVIQAIRSSAFDYLLKPVDPEELEEMIERFKSRKELFSPINENSSANKIRLNFRTGYILVDPSEVIMISAHGNYAEIHLCNKEKHIVSQAIGCITGMLPAGQFIRISRSALINIKFLRQVDRKNRTAILKTGDLELHASISREHMAELDELTQ